MKPASTSDPAADPPPRAGARAGAGWVRLAILLLAAAFRLWALDLRPPHFDEGVNGMFTDEMQRTGFYRYDPTNYHGPLHFYILFLFKCLFGRNLWALRLPEALAGIATVAWVFRFDRFFGRRLCAWAALALAVSPGFTFFHRYAIHETWLVLFMLVAAWGLLGLGREGTRASLWATAAGLTGMVLIKETYVIHLAALAVAASLLWALESGAGRGLGRPAPSRWRPLEAGLAAALGLAAILFFYSGGGHDPRGIAGLVTTFAPWAHTAQAAEGHNKPFAYWWLVLARNEPWALAGLVASGRYICGRSAWGQPMRLLALYAVGVFVAYSLIPYKTPWCVISIIWPFLFLAAAAVTELSRLAGRGGLGVSLLAGATLTAWSGRLAWDLNFRRPTDETENYVYVHTYDSVNRITGPLSALAAENPAYREMTGVVLCDSVHPLPWLLGDFRRVGYYTKKSSKRRPDQLNVDFLIVSEEKTPVVEAELREDYFRETLRLRPNLRPLRVYLRAAIFAHALPARKPEFRAARPAPRKDLTPRPFTPETMLVR